MTAKERLDAAIDAERRITEFSASQRQSLPSTRADSGTFVLELYDSEGGIGVALWLRGIRTCVKEDEARKIRDILTEWFPKE